MTKVFTEMTASYSKWISILIKMQAQDIIRIWFQQWILPKNFLEELFLKNT